MSQVRQHWDKIKQHLAELPILDYESTRAQLIKDDTYIKFIGKTRNGTLIKKDPL